MIITLKRILALSLMLGLLVTFCDPSQAALTGNLDSAEVEWDLGDDEGPGEHPITITNRYHVENTGFADRTTTTVSVLSSFQDGNPAVGSGSEDLLAGARSINYDYLTYTPSVRFDDYRISAEIFEKGNANNVLDVENWAFQFSP